jgi:hypothetical protein
LQLPLAGKLNEGWLEQLVSISPDKLAPSLGAVVSALAEEVDTRLPYVDTYEFLQLTELTENFKIILRNIHNTLSRRAHAGYFLDLGMGSGKTHLLTLILHLYAICPESHDTYFQLLREYIKEGCYDTGVAQNTVVLAFDLRALGDLYRAPLKLLARQLKRVGAKPESVDVVERMGERVSAPSAEQLAGAIPKHVNVVVIVDELYHALIFASPRPEVRDRVAEFLSFLNFFVNERKNLAEQGRSGLVVLVASARGDYERWLKISQSMPNERVVVLADSFLSQLSRVQSALPTGWIGLSDAKKILSRRLGCNFSEVFHSSFDRLIERVVKADTDIPQAHHLRSLIKALAIFALNALRSGDRVVTPARFSGEIVETLILDPEYRDLVNIYRSHYEQAIEDARRHGGAVPLAVNTIFAETLTGDEKKLIEMVKLAKTGQGLLAAAPLVEAGEVEEILEALGFDRKASSDALAMLRYVSPVIHEVRIGDRIAYFVAPVIDVKAYFHHLRRRLEDGYLNKNRSSTVKELVMQLASLNYASGYVEVGTVKDFEELRRFDPDKLYVLIYVEPSFIESLAASPHDKRESVRARAVERAKRFLSEKRLLNVVIIVPHVTDDTLRGVATYLATRDALSEVVTKYLAPYEKGTLAGEGRGEILRQLLEIELADVKQVLGRALNDAVAGLTSALSNAVSASLIRYDRATGVATEEQQTQNSPRAWQVAVDPLEGIVERFLEAVRGALEDVSERLASQVKDVLHFIDDPLLAKDIILDYARGELEKTSRVKVYYDARVYPSGGRDFYMPSDILKRGLDLAAGELREKYGERLRVIEDSDGKTFEVVEPAQPQLPTPLAQPPTAVPTVKVAEVTEKDVAVTPRPQPMLPRDLVESLIEQLRRMDSGVLELKVRFDRASASQLELFLRTLKDRVIEGRVFPAA